MDPSRDRPDRLVYVVGTGTEVGKTWVGARLAADLRARGVAVAARKLAQSFEPDDDEDATDAAVLGRATGEDPRTVCPPERWYPVALAPPMAAARLGRPGFGVGDLLGAVHWPARRPGAGPSVGLVESAGGVRSPQADDADAVDVGVALGPDLVVLVADAALGVINAVRLCVDALVPVTDGGADLVVVLNRFDPASATHVDSAAWLRDRAGLPVLALPGDEALLVARALAAA